MSERAMTIDVAQRQLDTRAIELAKEAVTLIEQHQRECTLERTHLASTLGEIKQAVGGLNSKMWSVAGISIITLVTALGVLVFFLLTNHHPG